jgi:hypothetical protein
LFVFFLLKKSLSVDSKQRITISSLYFGTGILEQELVLILILINISKTHFNDN